MRQEVFYLGYHMHWQYGELMEMPVDERHEFIRLLSEQIDGENKAMENAAKGRR